jgi:hypothetical protein
MPLCPLCPYYASPPALQPGTLPVDWLAVQRQLQLLQLSCPYLQLRLVPTQAHALQHCLDLARALAEQPYPVAEACSDLLTSSKSSSSGAAARRTYENTADDEGGAALVPFVKSLSCIKGGDWARVGP